MKLGIYKHYKGKYYKVIGIAIHTETDEKMVIYQALYETLKLTKEIQENYGINNFTFVRPYSMFFETIEKDEKEIPRFEYIGEIIEQLSNKTFF